MDQHAAAPFDNTAGKRCDKGHVRIDRIADEDLAGLKRSQVSRLADDAGRSPCQAGTCRLPHNLAGLPTCSGKGFAGLFAGSRQE